jgi:hypothetical protein
VPQQVEIKRRCAKRILELFPDLVWDVYLGHDEEEKVKGVEEILDVFGDSYANKHLLYAVLDLLVVRLLPEIGEDGFSVEALLRDKLELWMDDLGGE